MINLTVKAVEKIKEIAQSEGIEELILRVKILGGGCAGFSHDLLFDNKCFDMDEISEQDGIKITVDPLSYQYVDGITIDYLDGPMGSGFKFLNPNISSACGCGNSVAF